MSLDYGGKFRQLISTRHLDATTGMTVYVFCSACLLFILIIVAFAARVPVV